MGSPRADHPVGRNSGLVVCSQRLAARALLEPEAEVAGTGSVAVQRAGQCIGLFVEAVAVGTAVAAELCIEV